MFTLSSVSAESKLPITCAQVGLGLITLGDRSSQTFMGFAQVAHLFIVLKILRFNGDQSGHYCDLLFHCGNKALLPVQIIALTVTNNIAANKVDCLIVK